MLRATPNLQEHDGLANGILLALPTATLKRLRPVLKPINLTRGQVIDRRDGPIKHLYFVNRGLVSLVKTMQDGRTVEISAVGVEGITDPHALFGIETAVLETIVQIPGTAFRIARDRKSTRLNSSHIQKSRMPSSA